MNILFLSLFVISIILFVVSFFQEDRMKRVEMDLEELSINMIQEHYQLKKRLSLVEEEILVVQPQPIVHKPITEVNAILKNQVLNLHAQGIPLEQISTQSSLPIHLVEKIITNSN